ncbi:tetratricopeptide repeat protein [Flagellimonas onchidii]|uniref:tetratricopeptide repeat protein n=1 Tax=Flagellimonas onchidii TaxID=2562684 RepID=UPI0010A62C9D|nr:tetratricopeptide repeat protein [Allomuricauda onchidii]
MKTQNLLPFFLFICCSALYGQESTQLDNLIKLYNSYPENAEKLGAADDIFELTKKSDPQVALDYAHKALEIAKNIGFREGEAKAYKNLGFYHHFHYTPDSVPFYLEKAAKTFKTLHNEKEVFASLLEWTRFENLEGNFSKAKKLADSIIVLAEKMENGKMLIDALQRKSTIHLDKGEFKLAIEQLLNASRILDTLNPPNPIKQAIVDVGIGRTEMLRNNSEAFLNYLNKGLKTFQNLDDTYWLAITYMELGSAHYHLKDYRKAYENYSASLQESYKMKRDDFVAANFGNIGAVYMEQGDYDKALEYHFKSNNLAIKRGSINNQIIAYNDIGSAYFLKKDYTNSLVNFSNAIQLADSINSLDNLSDAYLERAEVYEAMGNHHMALEDLKAFQKLNDSVFNLTKSQQIEELKTQYDTEKKEQQIALQEKEITVLEQKAEISTLQKVLLGGLLVLSLFGFYGIRQKLKRNKLEKQKVDIELAFKKKELTTHALHLAKKNEVLEGLKQKAQELKEKEESKKGYQQLIRTINFDLQDDNNWQNFSRYFEEVHKDFNSNVKSKYPQVTSNELRLLALLKMNLSSKEIANILNISPEGIKKARYRLRKKLDITTEDSLQDLVLSL